MANLWVLSDLHQEWAENAWDPVPHAPEAFDVVVVAGDVDTPGPRALGRLAEWFPGVAVVYVLGNHDFYLAEDEPAYTLWDVRERAAEDAARHGIALLDDTSAVIAGTRFIGGTLWTDLRLGTSSRGEAHSTARRGMNDYRRIRRRRSGHHRHLRTEETLALHQSTRAYVGDVLAAPFAGPTVVVTHHAPSPRSLVDADLRHCYASNLEPFIEEGHPDVWIHGHTHRRSDYVVGGTRVVANPRGHGHQRQAFDPSFTVAV